MIEWLFSCRLLLWHTYGVGLGVGVRVVVRVAVGVVACTTVPGGIAIVRVGVAVGQLAHVVAVAVAVRTAVGLAATTVPVTMGAGAVGVPATSPGQRPELR